MKTDASKIDKEKIFISILVDLSVEDNPSVSRMSITVSVYT